tara:strand:- start:2249 stop:2923 length:675 start_codon:yes stop_codon:yes gene_type:complete
MSTPVVVCGVLFNRLGEEGDFSYMAHQPEHANAVFVICENVCDLFYAKENGGGTAALRTETSPISENPCAVGIPTGWSHETGGFRSLIPVVRTLIDLAVARVVAHLIKYPHVNKVLYSADNVDINMLGAGIFKNTLSAEVCHYMSVAVRDIPQRHASALSKGSFPTFEELRAQEILAPVPAFVFAQVIHERDRTARMYLALKGKLKLAGVNKRRHASTSFVNRR